MRLTRRSLLGLFATAPLAGSGTAAIAGRATAVAEADVVAMGIGLAVFARVPDEEFAYVVHGASNISLHDSVSGFVPWEKRRRELCGIVPGQAKREPPETRVTHSATALVRRTVSDRDPLAVRQDGVFAESEGIGDGYSHVSPDVAEVADKVVERLGVELDGRSDSASVLDGPNPYAAAIASDAHVDP